MRSLMLMSESMLRAGSVWQFRNARLSKMDAALMVVQLRLRPYYIDIAIAPRPCSTPFKTRLTVVPRARPSSTLESFLDRAHHVRFQLHDPSCLLRYGHGSLKWSTLGESDKGSFVSPSENNG